MTTLTKFALGMMGQLRPKPAQGDAATTLVLPPVDKHGGLPLMEALAKRRSSREFARDALPLPLLSGLLWAAYGENRSESLMEERPGRRPRGRTARTGLRPAACRPPEGCAVRAIPACRWGCRPPEFRSVG